MYVTCKKKFSYLYEDVFIYSHVGVAVAIATVVMGYHIPCFLCLLTSELCLLLWTLAVAMTTTTLPASALSSSLSPPLGAMAVAKVAVALLYPPLSKWLDRIFQFLELAGLVVRDLCVALFWYVLTTSLLVFCC